MDWLNYNSDLNNSVVNLLVNSNSKNSFSNKTSTGINLFAFKTDGSLKIKETIDLEAGLKFSASKTANLLNSVQTEGGQNPIIQFNDFNYDERIYAAYGNFNSKWNKKWNFQFGLRTELTKMKRLSVDQNRNQIAPPDTSYLNLFPTIYLRYQANDKHGFGISYNRRVDRPSFQDQNPLAFLCYFQDFLGRFYTHDMPLL